MFKRFFIGKQKKVVATLVCAAMLLSFSACSNQNEKTEDESTTGVTTEITESTGSEETNTDTPEIDDVVTEEPAKETFSDADKDVQKEFEEYLDDYFEEYVTGDTITYNYTVKNGADFDVEEPEVTLGDTDFSEEKMAEDKEEFDEWYEDLQEIDRSCLTEQQQLTYDILSEDFEVSAMSYGKEYYYEPFAPMKGLQANAANLFTDYRFDDKGDVERYIQLENMMRDYFNAYLEFEKVKSQKGLFMCDDVADKVIEQCENFVKDKDNHFLITVFDENIDKLDFLTDEEKAAYKEQNKDAVLNSFIPAYEDTIEVLTSLKGTGKNELGLCYLEDGKEYYEYLLKYYTGTDKTPGDVMNMMDKEIESLMTELYQVYFTNMEAYEYFAQNYDNLFAEADSMSSQEMIDKLMADATEHYPDMEKINYKAEALDKSLEEIMDGVLAYYLSPALDDEQNNLIRVNGKYTEGMWTTLAHEGYPGHMLQNAYFMTTDPDPVRLVLNYLGYAEGWAMYAAYDAISYYDFPDTDDDEALATLYRINDELSYLVMGRVDLGINYEGWTVGEVSQYLTENGFDGSGAEELFYTMVGDPAVYQSYSTGYYELKEIREYAEEKLGDAFDVKTFNTVVLETGPCQFDILKQQIKIKMFSDIL